MGKGVPAGSGITLAGEVISSDGSGERVRAVGRRRSCSLRCRLLQGRAERCGVVGGACAYGVPSPFTSPSRSSPSAPQSRAERRALRGALLDRGRPTQSARRVRVRGSARLLFVTEVASEAGAGTKRGASGVWCFEALANRLVTRRSLELAAGPWADPREGLKHRVFRSQFNMLSSSKRGCRGSIRMKLTLAR
jgi:hypothetical protein